MPLHHYQVPISPPSTATISCTLSLPDSSPSAPLIIFVNGLLSTSASWTTLTHHLPTVPTLAYDRFNVPPSSALPSTRTHNDISTAAHDLALILPQIYLDLPAETPLLLVGSSIGCCIIRLFIQHHAARYKIAGVLFLDSYIANTDFTSLFPPAAADEPEALTRTRNIISQRFHPSIENPEHLDRSTAKELLPSASGPRFPGDPELVVVSHDPEFNVDEMVVRLGIDKECYLQYVESAWDAYNDGLVQLSAKGRRVRAERSGHFIHQDRLELVVREIEAILGEVLK